MKNKNAEKEKPLSGPLIILLFVAYMIFTSIFQDADLYIIYGILILIAIGILRDITGWIKNVTTPRYARIIFWIKNNYKYSFYDGMANYQVRAALENVVRDLEAKGVPEYQLTGFRKFIEKQDYSSLVKVREDVTK